MSGSQLLLLGGTPQVVSDPNFEYTTLLLPGNGTNGAQNNTFLDSSTNNFTITRNGNTTQGTFSPFSQTGWGNYFDGTSGQFLNTVANTAFNFGTGDFTVEGWVYPTSTSGTRPIVEIRTSAANSTGFALLSQSGATTLNVYTNGGFAGASTGSLATNQWNHVALVRSGNTWTYYINGTASGSFTNSSTQSDGGTTGPKIGGSTTAGEIWVGYLSNIRIVKGTAVYTSNFTPSTTPLTAISGTSLLTCQSNRFVDNSTNAFAITVNGSPSIQAFSPFNPTAAWSAATNGGSGYFDGSGDYLSVADSSAFTLGSGDFTVECWVYRQVSGSRTFIYGQSTGADNINTSISAEVNASNKLVSYTCSGTTAYTATSTNDVPLNQWVHVAIVRNGTTVAQYINGAKDGEVSVSTSSVNDSGQIFGIGSLGSYVGLYWNGYIASFRLVKGTAVYTANFTPPTSPLTAITNTSLLCNFTNAGIYDATSKNDLETVGNAQISTTQSKFGGSSIAFDGNGDYLVARFSATNRINTSGNFTIEFWAYFNSVAADQRLIAWDNNSTNFVAAIYTNTSGNLAYYLSSTGTTWNIAIATSMGSIAINTWYHVALVRNGSVFTPYINGVAGTTTTSSATLFASTLPLVIGATGNGASFFNGYIDDFRITNGVARYTSNFTPPTTAFPLL